MKFIVIQDGDIITTIEADSKEEALKLAMSDHGSNVIVEEKIDTFHREP